MAAGALSATAPLRPARSRSPTGARKTPWPSTRRWRWATFTWMAGSTMIRGDIYDLLALAALNIGGGAPTAQIALWQKLRRLATKLRPGVREDRSRANVAHHYDLDSRLYHFFLDCDLQYSCAYFDSPDSESRGGATGQEAPYRRQAGGRARPENPRHRLRLGRPGALSGATSARPKCTASPFRASSCEGRAQASGRTPGSRTGFAFELRIIARFRAVSTASSRSACSSMSVPKHYDAFFARVAELLAETGWR